MLRRLLRLIAQFVFHVSCGGANKCRGTCLTEQQKTALYLVEKLRHGFKGARRTLRLRVLDNGFLSPNQVTDGFLKHNVHHLVVLGLRQLVIGPIARPSPIPSTDDSTNSNVLAISINSVSGGASPASL